MTDEVKGDPLQNQSLALTLNVFPLSSLGTVRRFLEIHGETIEKVVFAVSEVEEVFY